MNRFVRSVFFLLILGLSLVFLAFSLPALRFSPRLELDLASQDQYTKALEAEVLLGQTQVNLLILRGDSNQYAALIHDLSLLKNWSAKGAYNVFLPFFEGDELVQLPLWEQGKPPLQTAFDTLFWSPDYHLWKVYLESLTTEPDWVELEPLLVNQNLALLGQSRLDWWVIKTLTRDLVLVFPLSVLILGVILGFLSRSFKGTLAMLAASVIPALGSLIPYGLFGRDLTYGSIVAPFLVMALSTTYTLHIHQHIHSHGQGLRQLFREKGLALLGAGGTTFLGFVTLLFSPVEELWWLGLSTLTGLGLVFVWTLGVLPLILKKGAKGDPKPKSPKQAPQWMRWGIPSLMGLLLLLTLGGLGQLKMGLSWKELFWPTDPEARGMIWLEELGDVQDPWVLVGQGPWQGYWLEPQVFLALSQQRFNRLNPSSFMDYTPVLEALNRAWDPRPLGDMGPELTHEILMELAEFLPRDQGLPQVLDPTGTRMTLSIFQNPPLGLSNLDFCSQVKKEMENLFPQVEWTWTGIRFRRALTDEVYAWGQVWGLALYFTVLMGGIFLTWLIRGARRNLRLLIVPVVPLATVVFLLGICGLLGWHVSPALSLILAGVAGVSVDDALLWAFLGQKSNIRKTIVKTTVILTLLLIPLLLSGTWLLAQIGILTSVAFFFSTLVVLWVLPWSQKTF